MSQATAHTLPPPPLPIVGGTPADRLRYLQKRAGYPTAAACSAALSARGYKVNYEQHISAVRGMSNAAALAYAEFFGTTPGHILFGDLVLVTAAVTNGGLIQTTTWRRQVLAPPVVQHGRIEAIEVVGDCLEPVYSNGDLLYYDRGALEQEPDLAALSGKHCLVVRSDGTTALRVINLVGNGAGLILLLPCPQRPAPEHHDAIRAAAKVQWVQKA